MNIPQISTVASIIWSTAIALFLVLAVLQARRAVTPKGQLLTTYLTDVVALFLVFDIGSSPRAIGFGALVTGVKAGITLIRASKEKGQI